MNKPFMPSNALMPARFPGDKELGFDPGPRRRIKVESAEADFGPSLDAVPLTIRTETFSSPLQSKLNMLSDCDKTIFNAEYHHSRYSQSEIEESVKYLNARYKGCEERFSVFYPRQNLQVSASQLQPIPSEISNSEMLKSPPPSTSTLLSTQELKRVLMTVGRLECSKTPAESSIQTSTENSSAQTKRKSKEHFAAKKIKAEKSPSEDTHRTPLRNTESDRSIDGAATEVSPPKLGCSTKLLLTESSKTAGESSIQTSTEGASAQTKKKRENNGNFAAKNIKVKKSPSEDTYRVPLRNKESNQSIDSATTKVSLQKLGCRKKLLQAQIPGRLAEPIPAQELYLFLICWKAEWLTMGGRYPPILDRTLYHRVQHSYAQHNQYASTYYGLHLLSIWCLIQRSFNSKPKKFEGYLLRTEEKTTHYKNECHAEFRVENIPVHESVILVTDATEGQMFGYVYRVAVKSCPGKPDSKDTKFFFYTKEKIEGSKIFIQSLCKARIFLRQYEALVSDRVSGLRTIVTNPSENRNKIRVVEWMPDLVGTREIGPLVNKIYESVHSDNHITLVNQPPDASKVLLISLVGKLFAEGPVVICLKDVQKMEDIARKLKMGEFYTMLAVKESEVVLSPDLTKFTLRERSKTWNVKEEVQVLQKSKIIVTVLSEIFLSASKAFSPKTVCIIDDAHLHTEAETAMAVHLKPMSLVLLGACDGRPEVDQRLKNLSYDITLFHRLLSVKTVSPIC